MMIRSSFFIGSRSTRHMPVMWVKYHSPASELRSRTIFRRSSRSIGLSRFTLRSGTHFPDRSGCCFKTSLYFNRFGISTTKSRDAKTGKSVFPKANLEFDPRCEIKTPSSCYQSCSTAFTFYAISSFMVAPRGTAQLTGSRCKTVAESSERLFQSLSI